MASHTFSHTSVLLWECIEGLNIRDGYTYVDCTTGGGGHSLEIAKRLGENGRLLCFDQDENAIRAALYPDEVYVAEGYLYFCAMEPESGRLYFSRTLQEHEQAVSRFAESWREYDRERGIE